MLIYTPVMHSSGCLIPPCLENVISVKVTGYWSQMTAHNHVDCFVPWTHGRHVAHSLLTEWWSWDSSNGLLCGYPWGQMELVMAVYINDDQSRK